MTNLKSELSSPSSTTLAKLSTSDSIEFGLTNDYMFKTVFQNSNLALRGLLCAILDLNSQQIISCEVTNPIILGQSINNKTCILDIRVRLNDSTNINLEMQVGHLNSWTPRSLYYLCDMYVNLRPGDDYSQAEPCIQISFLKNSPFPNRKKFVSCYQIMDIEDLHVYTGDFRLIMVDLSQTNTSNMKHYSKIQDWAKLILAKDWNEAEDLSKNSPAMREAVNAMKKYTEDEQIREQCLARILYEGDMSSARKEGFSEGERFGEIKINTLIQKLLQDDRLSDLKRCTTDHEYQKLLLKEYGLE